tara:strand:+ start:64 stop:342 length:279 start_codon:yes stop_codon:yes gene_type:complete
MNANELFKGLRRIRSRVNRPDFNEHFYATVSFADREDSYHLKQWEMFRDDIVSFWCYSSLTRQALIEQLVERHAAKEKQAEELSAVIDEVGI